MLCAVCYLLGHFEFQKHCYCNAVTLITDLICALFVPYAALVVNRIYHGKSLKTSFVSPEKPWNLIFAVLESPGKQFFYCLYEPRNIQLAVYAYSFV